MNSRREVWIDWTIDPIMNIRLYYEFQMIAKQRLYIMQFETNVDLGKAGSEIRGN